MDTFFYFIGIVAAIAITIYFVDGTHRMKDKFKGSPKQKSKGIRNNSRNGSQKKENLYQYPRAKICPCCGAHLEQHEVLVATMYDEKNGDGKQRVLIHGCRYCHKRDKKKSYSEIEI